MAERGVLHGHVVDAGPCPYLPEQRFHAFHVAQPAVPYRVLLDHRFRRSGHLFYRPMCPDCQACAPLRVPVHTFRPRRDQRRVWARNADLTMTWVPRGMDDERCALYRRYQQQVHHDRDPGDPAHLLLDDGGIPGGELHARDGHGTLLAVSVCDQVDDALSSVYCFYDPDERHRALGVVMALAELHYAHAQGLRWWYPGYYVADCAKMAYKARYQPAEVLHEDGWRPCAPS